MRLTRATLVNVCQHRNRTLEFSPGLNVITGANGSGKSNAMLAIKATLCNDFSFGGARKPDNINRLAGADEASFVETEWQSETTQLVVRRGLRKADSGIWLNGENEIDGRRITKESEITEAAMNQIGISLSVVNEMMFADFLDLHNVVKGSNTQRAQMFASVCGLAELDRLAKEAGVLVNKLLARADAFDPTELDAAALDWGTVKQSRKQCLESIADLQDKLEQLGDVALLKQQHARAIRDQDRREAASDTISKRQDHLRKIRAKVEEESAKLTKCGQLVDTQKLLLERALASHNRLAKLPAKRCHSLMPLVAVVDLSVSIKEAAAAFAQHRQQRLAALKVLRYQVEHNQSACGQCGGVIELSEAEAEEQRESIKNEESRLKFQDRVLRVAKQDYVNRLAKQDAVIKRLERKLAETQHFMAEANAALQTAESMQKQKLADIAAANEVLKDVPVRSKKDIQQLQAKVDEVVKIEQQLIAAERLLDEIRDLGGRAAARFRRMRAAKRSVSVCRDAANHWTELRAVCQRDRLPLRVIRMVTQPLMDMLNQLLDDMGAGFTAELSFEDFSFWVIKQDGFRERATRLSHAQTLMLATAFWVARHRVFLHHVPGFFLDEPSTNLAGDAHLQYAACLQVISRQLQETGEVGVIVTHDREIAQVATRIIEL